MGTPGINENSVPRGMELRLDAALLGLRQSLPPGITSITLRGVTYTPAELEAKLVSTVMPWKGAREAHELLRQFAQDKPDHHENGQELLADFKAFLAGHLGRDNEQLTRFGFKPIKRRRQLTVEEKALRAAKARLTREKRGTMGKRQREAIKQIENPTVSIGPDKKLEIQLPESSNPQQPTQDRKVNE